MILKEGGNAFKDEQGIPVTVRVNRGDVDPTLQWLETITGIPHVDFKLGSTGLKDTSGDLDIAVNPEKHSKDEVYGLLKAWKDKNAPEDSDRAWLHKSGISVHFKTPINGNADNGYVQTDLMFGDPDWLGFLYRADGDSNYKGMFRNILLSSLAKAVGLRVNDKGVFNRETNELVTFNPDETAQTLLGRKNATRAELGSVEKIFKALDGDPQKDLKLADFRDYAAKNELELPESALAQESLADRNHNRVVQLTKALLK